MTTCAEASEQASNVRAANPEYSNYKSVADYVVTVACWQNDLVCSGLYNGPADGYWGPNSRRAVQQQMRAFQYTGPIDGDWESIPGKPFNGSHTTAARLTEFLAPTRGQASSTQLFP